MRSFVLQLALVFFTCLQVSYTQNVTNKRMPLSEMERGHRAGGVWNSSSYIRQIAFEDGRIAGAGHDEYRPTGDSIWVMVQQLVEYWVRPWTNSSRDTMTYSSNGVLTGQLHQSWGDSVWENQESLSFAYDPKGHLTLVLFLVWDGDVWVNWTRETMMYDANSLLSEILTQEWNGEGWVNSTKVEAMYDGSRSPSEIIEYTWDGDQWAEPLMDLFSYDTKGYLILDVRYDWTDTAWTPLRMDTLLYKSGSGLTEELYKDWMDSLWVNSEKVDYTYDAHGYLIEGILQGWSDGAWINNMRDTLTYDAGGRTLSRVEQLWILGVWVNNWRDEYSWETVVTSAKRYPGYPPAFALSANYPNPFNLGTNFQFTIGNLQFVSLKVYNVLGDVVATLVNEMREPGQYSVRWDASGLPSGVYFCRLTAGPFSQTRKMVLMK